MAIDFKLCLLDDGQVELSESSVSLRVRVVPREVKVPFPSSRPVSAVYLLLDDARQVYYVGETDNANGRHKSHLRQYPWWNHAVYFHVDAFDVERLRKYLQDRVFSRVLSLQAGVVLVTRLAGFKGPVPNNGDLFWKQMCLFGRACRILPFIDDSLFSCVVSATGIDNKPNPQPWSARSLSAALVGKYGGSANGVYQVLTAYKGRKAGRKWRPILDAIGVEFDSASGLVADWSKAMNPLP